MFGIIIARVIGGYQLVIHDENGGQIRNEFHTTLESANDSAMATLAQLEQEPTRNILDPELLKMPGWR